MLVLSRNKRLFLAVVAGVLIAGMPVVAVNYWLSDLVQRQEQSEVELSAKRTVTIVESRLARVIAALDDLAARGVDSCSIRHIEALRRTAFLTTPVKEISITGQDGENTCSDHGLQLGQRAIVSSQPISGSNALLEAVKVSDKLLVRVRRPTASRVNHLAALIPSELFIAQTSTFDGGALKVQARIAMEDGTVISERGRFPEAGMAGDRISGSAESLRYGLTVQTSLDRTGAGAENAELRSFGFMAAAVIAVLLFVFAWLMPRDQRRNPVIDMERALQEGEFVPYYQPIVDISNGKVLGAEVLMRWCKSNGAMVPPASFIPLAESSGLIVDLTRYIMRRVCDEVGPALASRPEFKIGFNLAAQHFNDEVIVSDVQNIFAGTPIRLTQVVLEVTERQPLENLTVARRVVAALQGIGVRIAIDDVGTGHSGLSYMLKLGVDIIKIDKMFIDALGSEMNSTAIIDTLIDLARNMRMEIVAEGVENFDQVVSLRDRGIHAAQGFVFSPPLPAASLLQLLDAVEARPMPAIAAAAAEPERQRPAA